MTKLDFDKAGINRLSTFEIPKSHAEFLVYKNLIRCLKTAISKYAKGRVLDIGCGNKPYLLMFDGKISEYVGCDIIQSSKFCVDILSSADKIPLESNQFDTIFSTQTIEHVANHQGMLNEAYRLLKPSSYIIISGPMYWPLHEEPYDFFRFTKHGFKYILEKSGFKIIEINSNGGKWSVLGQTIILTMPFLFKWSWVRSINNGIFSWLDDNYYQDKNTLNYVVIAQKI